MTFTYKVYHSYRYLACLRVIVTCKLQHKLQHLNITVAVTFTTVYHAANTSQLEVGVR